MTHLFVRLQISSVADKKQSNTKLKKRVKIKRVTRNLRITLFDIQLACSWQGLEAPVHVAVIEHFPHLSNLLSYVLGRKIHGTMKDHRSQDAGKGQNHFRKKSEMMGD